MDDPERKIKDAFYNLRELRDHAGEKEFRKLLESLDADSELIKCVSEIARRFGEDSETFIFPYQRMMKIIGDDSERREMFLKSVYNFEPNKRGPGVGLNSFAKELRQERNEIAVTLKKYYKLYRRRLRLSDTETKEYQEIEYSMPRSIRDQLIETRENSEGKLLEILILLRDSLYIILALRTWV